MDRVFIPDLTFCVEPHQVIFNYQLISMGTSGDPITMVNCLLRAGCLSIEDLCFLTLFCQKIGKEDDLYIKIFIILVINETQIIVNKIDRTNKAFIYRHIF